MQPWVQYLTRDLFNMLTAGGDDQVVDALNSGPPLFASHTTTSALLWFTGCWLTALFSSSSPDSSLLHAKFHSSPQVDSAIIIIMFLLWHMLSDLHSSGVSNYLSCSRDQINKLCLQSYTVSFWQSRLNSNKERDFSVLCNQHEYKNTCLFISTAIFRWRARV